MVDGFAEALPMKSEPDQETDTFKIILAYALMIIGVGCAYLIIRAYGEGLTASGAALARSKAAAASGSADVMLHVLLALSVVIILARGLGTLFRAVHQPPVIGEIIA